MATSRPSLRPVRGSSDESAFDVPVLDGAEVVVDRLTGGALVALGAVVVDVVVFCVDAPWPEASGSEYWSSPALWANASVGDAINVSAVRSAAAVGRRRFTRPILWVRGHPPR